MGKFFEKLTKRSSQIPLEDVFKPGGEPTYTYVERKGQDYEKRIGDWRKSEFKILSVSGPTKSGKTVQLRRSLGDQAVWISGGTVGDIQEFWIAVCDQLDLSLESIETSAREDAVESSGGISVGVEAGLKTIQNTRSEITNVRRKSAMSAALHALESLPFVLVIDDFHYIQNNVQGSIVRAMKESIFNGAKIVVISVPHRSFDAVRVEKEMTGRLLPLEFSLWSVDELMQVAIQGFNALNCSDPENAIAERFAMESFGNPLLMQNLCLQLCRDNGVSGSDEGKELILPGDDFFSAVSDEIERDSFTKITSGPSQRKGRKVRAYRDGSGGGDIYEVVMLAVSNIVPQMSIKYEDIREQLKAILVDGDMPQKHEITNILESITAICRDQIEGEPVLEYDRDVRTLYISDPYFAFFLKWNRSAPR
ncbi:hypothetical protein [Corynebacterium glyciniphilum]|nr:hypothetical protein [Corynebacterium glyciniphilum]MDN6704686.1 ATP-binding protein [Corynebacterium glyciniphilum]